MENFYFEIVVKTVRLTSNPRQLPLISKIIIAAQIIFLNLRVEIFKRSPVMNELIQYGEQFEKIIDIIESAKERAYRKVNEELI